MRAVQQRQRRGVHHVRAFECMCFAVGVWLLGTWHPAAQGQSCIVSSSFLPPPLIHPPPPSHGRRKEQGTGELICRVCGANFICAVNCRLLCFPPSPSTHPSRPAILTDHKTHHTTHQTSRNRWTCTASGSTSASGSTAWQRAWRATTTATGMRRRRRTDGVRACVWEGVCNS